MNLQSSQSPTDYPVVDPSGNFIYYPKSRIAAGFFGIFLGFLGVHNFYLGFYGKAIAQLLITLLTLGIFAPISALWGIIEGILYLCDRRNPRWSMDAYGIKLEG